MRLPAKLRHYWAGLKEGEPGHRFQDRYERASKHRRQHLGLRVLKIAGATLAILVGIVEIFMPGPAILFLFVGGGMLATESRVVAKWMDAAEVLARKAWHALRNQWRKFSPGVHSTLGAAILCGAAARVLGASHALTGA